MLSKTDISDYLEISHALTGNDALSQEEIDTIVSLFHQLQHQMQRRFQQQAA